MRIMKTYFSESIIDGVDYEVNTFKREDSMLYYVNSELESYRDSWLPYSINAYVFDTDDFSDPSSLFEAMNEAAELMGIDTDALYEECSRRGDDYKTKLGSKMNYWLSKHPMTATILGCLPFSNILAPIASGRTEKSECE